MTDCYICGHPILEGQRAVPRMNQPDGDTLGNYERVLEAPPEWELEHANPADHLPTLYKTLEKQHAEALGVAFLKKDIRFEERERAAEMVEEFIAENLYKDSAETAVLAKLESIAERIRVGE